MILVSNEEVVDSKLDNCIVADDVNAFKDVFTDDSDMNPKAVICAEPLNTPSESNLDFIVVSIDDVNVFNELKLIGGSNSSNRVSTEEENM